MGKNNVYSLTCMYLTVYRKERQHKKINFTFMCAWWNKFVIWTISFFNWQCNNNGIMRRDYDNLTMWRFIILSNTQSVAKILLCAHKSIFETLLCTSDILLNFDSNNVWVKLEYTLYLTQHRPLLFWSQYVFWIIQ